LLTVLDSENDKLREQEPLIKSYIDMLMSNMREDAREGRPSDVVLYFNWTAFDIVGDLSFAQSFDALKTRTTHPWIKALFSRLEMRIILSELIHLSPFRLLIFLAIRIRAKRGRKVDDFCRAAVKKRRQAGDLDRPDFLGKVMQQNAERDDKATMSDEEINLTFNLIMIAGSETTATLLAGSTFLLLKNPDVLEKLKAEVRTSFNTEDDINMVTVRNKMQQISFFGILFRNHSNGSR
jgi:cytochrome P450